jgi:hypothetical protein
MATMKQELRAGVNLANARPEALLRSDHSLRFERGGLVYAADGRIGTLRHVVVDERAGVVTALVVEVDRIRELVLLPAQAVSKTGGSAVFLGGTHQQYEEWLERAPRYQAQQANKANLKALLQSRSREASDLQPAIVRVGKDFLETGAVTSAADVSVQNQ